MRKNYFIIILLAISGTLYSQSSSLFPMVPGVPVVHSPKSSQIYRGTPSIVRLPTGELLTSNDVFSDSISVPNRTDIFISRDNGENWNLKATVGGATWSGLFCHKGAVYLIGLDTSNGSNLAIRKSTDKGTTWTNPTTIVPGACHGSSTPVLAANGRIYKAYEHHYTDTGGKWMSGNKSFIVSASQDADLMQSSSWTTTDEISKPAWIDGTGWLESNAVLGKDGKVKGIMRLASVEGIYAGYYSLLNDSQIEEGSARKIQFWGGASKFNIRYDVVTDKYWSLANYAPSQLKEGNRSAGGLRSVLALTSSTDLEEWTVNAIVLAHTDPENVGFQYVDWIFDGNDILFVSRTSYDDGLGGADNYHNSNFMTFHRIENYVTATTAQEWVYLLPNDRWTGFVKGLDRSDNKGTSADNPILINHPGQIVTLSEEVYKGNSFENTYFKMTNDIDLNNFNFLPIGWYVTTTNNRPFSGHFNGNGYIIRNLNISRNDDVYSSNAVFGYLKSGSVSNLGVTGKIDIGGVCGGIVAYMSGGTVTNCFSHVNIIATSNAGGIVGYGVGSPEINNCYNRGTVHLSSTSSTNKYAGGVMGFYNTGVLSNSYNAGTVTASFTNSPNAGSLVGNPNSNPTNCYFLEGTVPAGSNNVGTAKSRTEMKSYLFVNELVNGQNPAPWEADTKNSNDGYPVLSWETQNVNSISSVMFSDWNIRIYPIPCKENLRIDMNGVKGSCSLHLYSLEGNNLIKQAVPAYTQSIELNTDALQSGIYLLRIVNNEHSNSTRIIVEK